MEITGKIIAALPKKSGVSNQGTAWSVQSYVIETQDGSQYPKKICFEVFGDEKINQFNIQIGHTLKVHFDIDAREWNGKWFNQIRAWKVENLSQSQSAPAQPSPASPVPQQTVVQPQAAAPSAQPQNSSEDELPF